MPETYSKKAREGIRARVIAGLSEGVPLAVLCREKGMPCDDTIRNWADEDTAFARDIARARERGFDVLAAECLTIADTPQIGEIVTEKPLMVEGKALDGVTVREVKTDDMLGHRKLRIETRLKLLAKWDPKRYGDKQLLGSDPENPLPTGFHVHLVRGDEPSAG